jgi:hypothetical protein
VYNPRLDLIASERYLVNTLSYSTPPSFFKTNYFTITNFNNASTDTSFPETKAGTLVTHKGVDNAIQYWYPYQSNNYYIRRQNNTGDSWSSFYKQDMTFDSTTIPAQRSITNTLTFATAPSTFKANSYSITNFNNASTETQFPETKAGFLITHKGIDNAVQYWYPYQSDNVYIRRQHNTTDTWLAFRNIFPINYSATLDFGTVSANSTKELSVTITGVAYGSDVAVVNPRGSLIAGLIWGATVNTDNTVTVRVANVTTAAITVPSTQVFMLKVFKV